MIHYSDFGFVSTLEREWPDFDGGILPNRVLLLLQRGQLRFLGKTIRLDCRGQNGFLFLRIRNRQLVDSLSPRQRMVALEYGRGKTHKEIAKLLGMSPATVRHHLGGVYSKLDIHGKGQLALALHAVDP